MAAHDERFQEKNGTETESYCGNPVGTTRKVLMRKSLMRKVVTRKVLNFISSGPDSPPQHREHSSGWIGKSRLS